MPSGFMNALESVVEFIRDSVVRPSVGDKWTKTWTPLLLTLFVFILAANAIGMIPIFEVLGLLNHWVFHAGEESFLGRLLHGGSTATSNFNVTAALAMVSFFAIIVAGSKAHGAVQHWKNLVPHGVSPFLAVALIPIEILGMLVRPFALTMRLAANMTGGHIAILAILSFVFIFTEMAGQSGRHGNRPGVLGAAGGGDLGARDHRDPGPGIRVHAPDGRVHRHGHSRAPLMDGTSHKSQVTNSKSQDGLSLATCTL